MHNKKSLHDFYCTCGVVSMGTQADFTAGAAAEVTKSSAKASRAKSGEG